MRKVCKFFIPLFIFVFVFSSASSVFASGTWTQHTSSGQRIWHNIATSADGTKLAATVENGYIYTSTDGGSTWTERTNAGSRNWRDIASSDDGTKLVAGVYNGYIYTSTDSGATWTERTSAGSKLWNAITSSDDGTKLVAGVYNGYIYTSTDSGATWTERNAAGVIKYWFSIASSDDGTKLVAAAFYGPSFTKGSLYTSTDSGATWTERTSAGAEYWGTVASSADGTKVIAAANNSGYVYTSTDSGVSWTQQTGLGSANWDSVTSSTDGSKLAAARNGGYIFISTDSGANWNQETSAGSRNWRGITSSDDGTKLAVAYYNGYIWTYVEDDSTPPTITSVSSDKTNGTYGIGEVIDIDVTFDEAVTSTGSVTVTLETGDTDRTCTFTVSNSTTGTCNYTVQAGDTSADLTVSSISGTIADQSANAMVNFVPATNLAANKALVIDGIVPIIQTLTPADDEIDVAIDSNLVIQFSEAVTIGSRGSFEIYMKTGDTLVETIDATGGQVTGDGTDTITINPLSDLSGGTEYYLLQPTPVFSDASGNSFAGISDTTTWSFTTIASRSSGGISRYTSASCKVSDRTPTVGETVQFDVSVSTTESSYLFKWVRELSGKDESVSHDFSKSGKYYPRAEVKTDAGTAIANCGVVTVSEKDDSSDADDDVRNEPEEAEEDDVAPKPSTITAAIPFTETFVIGTTHPDVKRIQTLLNTFGFTISHSGPGAPGNETDFFGTLTKNALTTFQTAVKITPANGTFGPQTKEWLNFLQALVALGVR